MRKRKGNQSSTITNHPAIIRNLHPLCSTTHSSTLEKRKRKLSRGCVGVKSGSVGVALFSFWTVLQDTHGGPEGEGNSFLKVKGVTNLYWL